MANKDIRIAVTLPDHPKTVMLMRKLGDKAFWCLTKLWVFTAMNAPDGNLSRYGAEELEIAAGWTGDDDVFIDSLIEMGFMDEIKETGDLKIHDWEEHNPYAAKAKERSDRARAAAIAKHGLLRPSAKVKVGQNADSAKTAKPLCPLPLPSPSPYPKEKSPVLSPDAVSLCFLLKEKILTNDLGARVPDAGDFVHGKGWGRDARLLLEKDGRTTAEAASLITWATSHTFWKSNILSMGKFREKYTTLKLQREGEKENQVQDYPRGRHPGDCAYQGGK